MAIDASIALNVRPPQVEDPLSAYGKVLSIGDMMQRRQLNDAALQTHQLENETRQRAAAADKALADLYTQHTAYGDNGEANINHDAIQQGLAAQGFGDRAMKYGADVRAEKRLQMEDHQKKLDLLAKQNKMVGDATSAILQDLTPDPTNPNWAPPDMSLINKRYANTRATLAKNGIDVSAAPASLLGSDGHLDPAALAYIKDANAASIGAENTVNNHRQDLQLGIDFHKFQDAHASSQVKNADDWTSYAARLFSNAGNGDRWTQVRSALQEHGIPPQILNQFAPAWSQQAQKDAAMLTPEQQANEADRAATRAQTAARDARSAQHMDALERFEQNRIDEQNQVKKNQLLSIEARKNKRLKAEEEETLKQLKEQGLDQPVPINPNDPPQKQKEKRDREAARQVQRQAIYAGLEKRKQQVQDDYENELGAVGIYTPPVNSSSAPEVTPPASTKQVSAPVTPATILRNSAGHEIRYDSRKNAWVDAQTGAVVK